MDSNTSIISFSVVTVQQCESCNLLSSSSLLSSRTSDTTFYTRHSASFEATKLSIKAQTVSGVLETSVKLVT